MLRRMRHTSSALDRSLAHVHEFDRLKSMCESGKNKGISFSFHSVPYLPGYNEIKPLG